MVDEPKRSQDRHLNKIFDNGRVKTKEQGNCHGCDISYGIRDQIMQVGKVTRGGLKNMRKETADIIQKDLNIDMNSILNRGISSSIQDRGKTVSAYEGDNHFHNICKVRVNRKNFSELMH
jgi:hypothetical protein